MHEVTDITMKTQKSKRVNDRVVSKPETISFV